jgi:general secretion pathway protein E
MTEIGNEAEALANEIDVTDELAATDELAEVAGRVVRVPYAYAKRHNIAVSELHDDEAVVVYQSKTPVSAIAEVRRLVQRAIRLERIEPEKFEGVLSQIYQGGGGNQQMMEDLSDEMDLNRIAEEIPETEDLLESEDDAPIIKLINALFSQAIKEGCSDIHIETFERELMVRFRVDGVLKEILRPNRKMAPLLVSRIKVMAKLDIAEKRIPQDGRIALRLGGRAVDIRVSTMPSSHGERVVLRLLDKEAGRLDLTQLGMLEETSARFNQLIHKPHGILLVTGPTGSGKTTTLYAGLQILNDGKRNILTVEDPVEYMLDGIGQTQVNPKVDMTFARGLRAILRQDPDVVMVGEIRDLETAQISVQASLTGHLVLSTLHTNTAIGAVTRLRDMGVEPFLLSSSLLGVIAQRLVRRLCTECREPHVATQAECEKFDFPTSPAPTIYRSVGCDKCNHTGYSGRTGIHELVVIDDKMQNLIHDGASEHSMLEHARTVTPSIRDDGRYRILQGETTIEEVVRVTREG